MGGSSPPYFQGGAGGGYKLQHGRHSRAGENHKVLSEANLMHLLFFAPGSGLPRLPMKNRYRSTAAEGALSLSLMIKKQTIKAGI
ncbi:hypothetical protein CA265_05090 [Sphingobacteriaceae bacterium GW460-11-11-14-LB5]|nr:hypothetical protein CA265_05090 [Sphingobacteriaceae bacterium GW460-11-11-14-LB5]